MHRDWFFLKLTYCKNRYFFQMILNKLKNVKNRFLIIGRRLRLYNIMVRIFFQILEFCWTLSTYKKYNHEVYLNDIFFWSCDTTTNINRCVVCEYRFLWIPAHTHCIFTQLISINKKLCIFPMGIMIMGEIQWEQWG